MAFMATPKPLLLLDVDGVVNAFKQITKKNFIEPKVRGGGQRYSWQLHNVHPTGWEENGLRLVMSEDHGAELRKLQELYTLIWATTWRHEANKWISPRLGLPELPVIDFADDGFERDWVRNQKHRGSWKTFHIARWLDDYAWYRSVDGESKRLPWAFVDDEVNRFDNEWLRYYWNEPDKTHPVAPRKLLRTEPSRGLDWKDFQELWEWGKAHQVTDAKSVAG